MNEHLKDHFNLRSLIFYATAIGSVVILFTVTSAYGERHLQAPRPIEGRYSLSMQAPAECFQSQPPHLVLQQSGIFLTGVLVAADASEQTIRTAHKRPALGGQWRNDRMTLAGALDSSWNCPVTVRIDAQVRQDTLNGTLTLSSIAKPIPFSGDRQVIQSESESH